MKNIVILFSGTGTNLLNLIEQLHGRELEVAAAITNRPDAGGIAKARAKDIHVDIIDHKDFESREAFDSVLVDKIKSYPHDLVVMAGFMRILTPHFTDNIRAINLHPSLLPKFKGAHAIERSFESSDKEGGVSVHWVSGELDGGEVIAQKSFVKETGESMESFTEKIRRIEHDLLPKTITRLLITAPTKYPKL